MYGLNAKKKCLNCQSQPENVAALKGSQKLQPFNCYLLLELALKKVILLLQLMGVHCNLPCSNLRISMLIAINQILIFQALLSNYNPGPQMCPAAKQIELDLLRTLPNNKHYESPHSPGWLFASLSL